MTIEFALLLAALPVSCLLFMVAHANERSHKINLPTSKAITVPVPGFIARTNSFPPHPGAPPNGYGTTWPGFTRARTAPPGSV